MKINIKNLEEELSRIVKTADSKIKENMSVNSVNLVTELSRKTPVDTGRARDSWNLELNGDTSRIINDVPYIDRLNAGSSKQAPAHFVESTALKYGKPVGSIVTYK